MTVCLVMIAKDEEAVIERCLTSALPLIDSYVIVDTGSSDDTRDVAMQALGDMTGEWIERPWLSFGKNLTEALHLARGKADWLLRLDADMTLELHPGLREWLADDPSPFTDAWQVEVVESWGHYRLPLLVRGEMEWGYEGVTHEYLSPSRNQRPLLGLTVHHHADGSSQVVKFERDRELLEDAYEKNPDDARTVFYLAQTYRGLGETERAIELYERRSEMDGWEEESWYAAYQASKLKADVAGLLAVHQSRPWRHEPLKAAATLVAQENHDSLFVEAM